MLEVGAAVIVHAGCALICQRRPGATHPGKWEFPGGKRLAQESLPACVARELQEELAIDADVGEEIWRTRHYYRDHATVDLFFFLVRSFRGTPTNRAFADLRWVALGELSGFDFLAADRALVAWLDRRPLG